MGFAMESQASKEFSFSLFLGEKWWNFQDELIKVFSIIVFFLPLFQNEVSKKIGLCHVLGYIVPTLKKKIRKD